ncbi:MAG: hypothetical protein QOH31_1468 [Verrucomicrobiota bacterium]|jgi:hypothetical protein
MRIYDHIDLRVRDRARAQRFFAKLLPALGFIRDQSGNQWGAFDTGVEGTPTEFFGFTEDSNHRPNETRIAFWAETREIVDRVTKIVGEAGGKKSRRSATLARVQPRLLRALFRKTLMEINWKFVVAAARLLWIEKVEQT